MRDYVMAKNRFKADKRKWQLGQSLVEAALFLPIFLIIIGGVVEVAQLVVTQNRITDAARASTRFAANGGEDTGMINVIMNAVTGTVNMQTGSDTASLARWDIWKIRGTTVISGDELIFQEAEDEWLTHIWGGQATKDFDQVTPATIKTEVLNELLKDLPPADRDNLASGLDIVGTYIIYDVDSILGLDATPGLGEIHSVRELIVMRVAGLNFEPSKGCSAFPLAVHDGLRSVTDPGAGSNPYPYGIEFDFPKTNPPVIDQFFSHNSKEPKGLYDAFEGYVFKVTLNAASQQFGWLQWNTGIGTSLAEDETALANSLGQYGNSNDYQDHGDPGNPVAAFGHVIRGYVEPNNTLDDLIQTRLVAPSDAQLTGVDTPGVLAAAIQDNIRENRALRLIVFNAKNGNNFVVTDFAIFRIKGYGNSGGDEWLLLEFVRLDKSCGQN
jgi:hypothetical protein